MEAKKRGRPPRSAEASPPVTVKKTETSKPKATKPAIESDYKPATYKINHVYHESVALTDVNERTKVTMPLNTFVIAVTKYGYNPSVGITGMFKIVASDILISQ